MSLSGKALNDPFFATSSESLLFRTYKNDQLFVYTDEASTSLVLVLFKYPEFFPKIIQLQLSTIDFLSYCGGSLGLFLGFSALSAVEFLYYFTLRMFCKRMGKKAVAPYLEEDEEPSKNYLVELMDSSSVHGCNQVVMKHRNCFERFVKDWEKNSRLTFDSSDFSG
jgi:hypothetical protein